MARKDTKKLSTNADGLVETAVKGEVTHPVTGRSGWDVTRDGGLQAVPGMGGISYSHLVGDRCVGSVGDHIEPGVSISNFDKKWGGDQAKNALCVFAQIGNTAIVTSGDAKGAIGTVTGKHGGIEHVLVHFPSGVLDALDIGDTVRIRSRGLGLALRGHDDVAVRNLDPRLLERLPIRASGKSLRVGVSRVLPAQVMGSGLGSDNTHRGDYDIQLSDPAMVKKLRLDGLRFGDIVALEDTYDAYGRSWRPGAVSIGIVVHGDSRLAGHGPGVTTILAAQKGRLKPQEEEGANIADLLSLSRDSAGDHHDERILTRSERVLEKLEEED